MSGLAVAMDGDPSLSNYQPERKNDPFHTSLGIRSQKRRLVFSFSL